MYTLQQISTGFFPEIEITSNGPDSDFCNDCTVKIFFTKYPDNLWVVYDCEVVKQVAEEVVPWYNSSVNKPTRSEKIPASDLRIVDIRLIPLVS